MDSIVAKGEVMEYNEYMIKANSMLKNMLEPETEDEDLILNICEVCFKIGKENSNEEFNEGQAIINEMLDLFVRHSKYLKNYRKTSLRKQKNSLKDAMGRIRDAFALAADITRNIYVTEYDRVSERLAVEVSLYSMKIDMNFVLAKIDKE